MKKENKNKQAALSTLRRPRIRLAIGVSIVALAIAGVGIWLINGLTKNSTLYSRDKHEVETTIRQLVDEINLPGDVAYHKVIDNECSTRNSVGLAYYVHCEFSGYKFYKHQGDLEQDLRITETTLNKLGFTRSPAKDQKDDDFDATLQGNGGHTITYAQQAGTHTTSVSVQISYYRSDKTKNDYIIQQLIDDKLMLAPTDQDYLYGALVQAGYFSCSGTCPASPNTAKQ